MKHTNSIFHQLLQFLPRQRFQSVVDRHKGDHRARSLTCWGQLVALLFAQLSGRTSLRDLVDTSIVNTHIIIILVPGQSVIPH